MRPVVCKGSWGNNQDIFWATTQQRQSETWKGDVSKIQGDRIPTDPVQQVNRAIRYSVFFFRGPWTVGPVGDFLER